MPHRLPTLRCFHIQSSLTLCDPMDSNLPVSSVHGILQAGILEWVATSFSKGSSPPGIVPASPAMAGGFLTTEPQGSPIVKRAQRAKDYIWMQVIPIFPTFLCLLFRPLSPKMVSFPVSLKVPVFLYLPRDPRC